MVGRVEVQKAEPFACRGQRQAADSVGAPAGKSPNAAALAWQGELSQLAMRGRDDNNIRSTSSLSLVLRRGCHWWCNRPCGKEGTREAAHAGSRGMGARTGGLEGERAFRLTAFD